MICVTKVLFSIKSEFDLEELEQDEELEWEHEELEE